MAELLTTVNWIDIFTTNFTPDDIWSAFRKELDEAIEQFVPAIPAQNVPRAVRRYPRYIRILFNCKLAVWKRLKLDRTNNTLKISYKKISCECRDAVRRYEIAKENEIINSDNLGRFYRFINSKMSCRSGVGSLINSDGDYATTDDEKANILNSYFGSVCTADDGLTPPFSANLPSDIAIDSISFHIPKLIRIIRKIKSKNKLSYGPDGYPAKLLTALAPVIAEPLSLMYSSFLSVGQMPTAWKSAIVTPVFKKGSPSDPANYRPISQTSVFCKLMERAVTEDIINYLQKNNLISPQQHGFLSKRSTLTNLLETMDDWTISINNKQLQTAIYIDFSKAFDTVSHPKLLLKLNSYGIRGDLMSLIEDFLTDRSQRTRVGSRLSSSTTLTSGIVQGSCLGPLLFVIYINDVTRIFGDKTTAKLYADDLKLYSVVESQLDSDQLQQCLDCLHDWAKTWQLTISIKKCQSINIGGRGSLRRALEAQFQIGNDILPCVESVADLGVTVDSSLKFSLHVSKIVRKAATRCYLLKKCFFEEKH